MEQSFQEKITALLAKKRSDNSYFISNAEYLNTVAEIKETKLKQKKDKKDYRRLGRFDVLTVGETEKLIHPLSDADPTVRYYVATEELYSVLHETHLAIGHGGRNRMVQELKLKYCNVTKETIMIYLSLCKTCNEKRATTRKGLVVKPILSKEMNSRAQMDLIDMQSKSVNDFRFIMVYQDHLTKFCSLRALKRKEAEEVAMTLVEIWSTFGAPVILHSDNGREFKNKVTASLTKLWPGMKVVHGKPRHSQSQGSVERANRDIEEILGAWLIENKTDDWVAGLKVVQFMKNRAYHQGIKRSPYEAMFGCPAKVGLKSTSLPENVINDIESEEDLMKLLQNDDGNAREDGESENEIEIGTVEDCDSLDDDQIDAHKRCIKCSQLIDSDHENSEKCSLCISQETILNSRDEARKGLEIQANKMLKTSNLKFQSVPVGKTVAVPVPDVDRGRTDMRNILAVVMKDDNGFYKLGTEYGILKSLYTRSQFTVRHADLISISDVPEKEISLREAATTNSVSGGQGYKRCNCRQKCTTNRCACRAAGLLCNSKCHKSEACTNK